MDKKPTKDKFVVESYESLTKTFDASLTGVTSRLSGPTFSISKKGTTYDHMSNITLEELKELYLKIKYILDLEGDLQ